MALTTEISTRIVLRNPYDNDEHRSRAPANSPVELIPVLQDLVKAMHLPSGTKPQELNQEHAIDEYSTRWNQILPQHHKNCLVKRPNRVAELNKVIAESGMYTAKVDDCERYGQTNEAGKCVSFPSRACSYARIVPCELVDKARLELFRQLFPATKPANPALSAYPGISIETALSLLFGHVLQYGGFDDLTAQDFQRFSMMGLVLQKIKQTVLFNHHLHKPVKLQDENGQQTVLDAPNLMYMLRDELRKSPIVIKLLELDAILSVNVASCLDSRGYRVLHIHAGEVEKNWRMMRNLTGPLADIVNWTDDEVFCVPPTSSTYYHRSYYDSDY